MARTPKELDEKLGLHRKKADEIEKQIDEAMDAGWAGHAMSFLVREHLKEEVVRELSGRYQGFEVSYRNGAFGTVLNFSPKEGA